MKTLNNTQKPPIGRGRLDDSEFRIMLSWFMCSDPWPLNDQAHKEMRELLDSEARIRRYDNWVHAYYDFKLV
jgi:hypothetical protein